MTTHDSPVDEEIQLDYAQDAEDEWLDEPEQQTRRPRRKLFSPIPATLLVVLLVAGGFFAGVQVEKGQSSASTSNGLPAGLAALRSAAGGSSSGARSTSGGGSGFPAGGFPGVAGLAGGGLTTGEVSYVSGSTLYVSSGENTIKVSAPAGTKVTKTVSTSVHSIHPGDTVIVRGSQGGKGSVTASSISISSAGTGTGSAGSSGSGGAGPTQQLFGSG